MTLTGTIFVLVFPVVWVDHDNLTHKAMVKSNTDWVEASQDQLALEAGARAKKVSLESGLAINAPLEPIPDNDWQGETWGLFWPDQELEDKSEDPTKYIKVVSLAGQLSLTRILSTETLRGQVQEASPSRQAVC